MSYTVRVADGPADLEACFAVRKEVFVGEQNVPEELERDLCDADAVHLLAIGPEGPLGAGRLLRGHDEGVGVLGRMAVSAAARGLGVGAALVRAIEAEALRLGLTVIVLHAQTHALGFYERLGYTGYGPEHEEAGIQHREMRRALAG